MKMNTENIKKENDLLEKELEHKKELVLFLKALNDIWKSKKFIGFSVIGFISLIIDILGIFKINLSPLIGLIIALFIVVLYMLYFGYTVINKMNEIYEKEIENLKIHQQKIKEILESLDLIRDEVQKSLFSNLDKLHDVIHNIRDSLHEALKNPENPFPNFNFEKLIQMTLDELKEFFEHTYSAKFVTTVMEVNDTNNPEYLVTMFYSSNALEERKKFRSIVPAGEGIAGKMLNLPEPKPVIWEKRELYLNKFRNKKGEDIGGDDRNWNAPETKNYEKGISSPFKVSDLIQGVINIDTPSKDLVFLEEDKYVVKTFGDICALIYEINGLKEMFEPQNTSVELDPKLREIIEKNMKITNN